MLNLSLNFFTEPEEGKERFVEDRFFNSLEERAYQWYSNDFTEIVNDCRYELNSLMITFKTEELKMFSEGWKDIINKIWDAIKRFFTKLGSILMFWKKKVTNFFSDRTRELEQLEQVIAKISVKDSYDEEKINKFTGNLYFKKSEHKADYTERYLNSNFEINNLNKLIEMISTYINDPEMNDKDKLVAMEKSEEEVSFKKMLGIEFISNTKEELAPSRMIIQGSLQTYEAIKIGNDIKLSNVIDVKDPNLFNSFKTNVQHLLQIVKRTSEVKNLMDSIEKSYQEINEGLKWKIHAQNSADQHVSIARTSAVVRAKDHVVKSKELIEEFVKLINIHCFNLHLIVHALFNAKK